MQLIVIEFHRMIGEIKAYYADYIVNFIMSIFMLFFVIDRTQDFNTSYFAYMAWMLASGVLSEASVSISNEKQNGTLQNLMITPYGILPIALAKTLNWFLLNLGKTLLVSLVLYFSIKGMYFDPRLIIVLLLQFIGILGASLVMAALTLAYTKVASFETIISIFLLYLSGSVMSVSKIFLYSNPLSYGTHLAGLIYQGKGEFKEFAILTSICLIWFGVGYGFFKLFFAKAQDFKWKY